MTLPHSLPATSTDATLNLFCSLGAFPASSMSKPSKDDTCTDYEQDFISRGQIPQDNAEEHFRYYQKHLDPYLHNILALEDCLADIRSRSSLLTAAICTSAAFCSGSKDYDVCFKVLRQEVSGKMFSNHHTFDDVRALCIGAFWLHDVSSALNALGEFRILCAPLPLKKSI